MSGAEALGLACNILTVISFAHETISLCKSVYQGNPPGEELYQSAKLLAATSKDVQQQDDALQQRPRPASQKRLRDVAAKCNIAARGLQEEAEYLSKHQKRGDLIAMLKVAAKSKWRKSRLEKFERSMSECRREMDTQLLHRICSQGDAVVLQQKDDFAHLDHRIQYLVNGIATGQDETLKLVAHAARETQGHVTRNLSLVEQMLKLHIDDSVDKTQLSVRQHTDLALAQATERILVDNHAIEDRRISQNDRDQLLNSLKFPQMNERRNTLSDPEEDTYRWIFKTVGCSDDGSETDSSSEDGSSRSSGEYSYYIDSTKESTSDESGPILDGFVDWLQSDAKSYWISGKPGSGKSTLLKYIASARECRTALSIWAEDIVIISYYFWKAGSLLQRSLRGLYFDLLHQLLGHQPSSLDGLAARISTLSGTRPQEHTDWSTATLRHELATTLKEYPCNICIFIDGLDEVCDEDGSAAVLEITRSFLLLSNVKVCVSSRPEPAFRKTLGHWPQLRMEDLTCRDIEIFSRRQLASTAPLPIEQLYPLLQDLVEKAKGVFLWVHLAVRSLRSGLDMGDELADLKRRLQDLPGEFEQLYWDMWQRSNKESSVHREFSSSIIELLIQFRDFEGGALPSCSFTLALANQPNLLREDSSIYAIMDQIHNEEFWKAFEIRVGNRCAGIVEFAHCGDHCLWSNAVGFIHRSAYDFFTETDKGRLIRSYGSRYQRSHRLLCASALFEVWRLPASLRDCVATGLIGVHIQGLSDRLCNGSVSILHQSNELCHGQGVAIVFRRHYQGLRRFSHGLSADFLAVSAASFEELVITQLTNLKASERRKEASIVLRYALHNDDVSVELIQRLLDLGADFAPIKTTEDVIASLRRRIDPSSALSVLFVKSMTQGYSLPRLLFTLQQPGLPLSQKTQVSIVFGESAGDPLRLRVSLYRPYGNLLSSAHSSVSGWRLFLVVNIAHLLKIFVENIQDGELSNLAAWHLREHQPAATCIACVGPQKDVSFEGPADFVYYVPEQRVQDHAVDILSKFIEPRQEGRRPSKEVFPWKTFREDLFRGPDCSSWITLTHEQMVAHLLSHLDLSIDDIQSSALPTLLHVRRRGGGYRTHLRRSDIM